MHFWTNLVRICLWGSHHRCITAPYLYSKATSRQTLLQHTRSPPAQPQQRPTSWYSWRPHESICFPWDHIYKEKTSLLCDNSSICLIHKAVLVVELSQEMEQRYNSRFHFCWDNKQNLMWEVDDTDTGWAKPRQYQPVCHLYLDRRKQWRKNICSRSQ